MKGFDNIKIEPAYGIKIISDIKIESKINEHATLYLYGIVDETVNFNSTVNASFDDEIHIYEAGESNKTIFKGLITSVETKKINGVYYAQIQGISGSFRLDIKKKSRSFQDMNMTYPELVKGILGDYPKNNFINTICDGVKIGEPVLQYKETDWELIKRLASRFNSVIAVDIYDAGTRLCFGFPEGASCKLEDSICYTANKDIMAYMKAKGSGSDVKANDFFYYDIESREQYKLGDEISFRNKKMYVTSIDAYMEKGILTYRYRISMKEGIYVSQINNSQINGVSIGGNVLDTKGELVKLHLDIDEAQDKGKAFWFPFIPPTGDIMYCMPQKGTHASLYFPDATGNNAKVIGCVRKNGGSCQKTSDPNTRFFGTEHGSELEMSPKALNIVGDSKEPIKISMEDENGITIVSHKKLTMNSVEEMSITTPKHIKITAKDIVFLKKSNSDSGFTIENEFHYLSNYVFLEGRVRELYPPFDDAPKVAPKPPFNWGKLALNVLGGLAIVAAVAAAAVFTVATFGAGAVVIGAVATCAVVGGTAAVASQAVSDIMSGEVSDFSDYAAAAARETIVGAISGAVFGPLGPAASLGGKMAIGAANNAFESIVRQTLEGKGINPWAVLLDAGIGAGTAGIMDSKIAKNIGKAIDNAAPWIKKGANKVMDGISDNANKVAKLAGEAGDIGETAARKSIMDPKKSDFCGDPINVSNGSFYLDVTDLVIEDRGIDLEIKRRYNSIGLRKGIMGDGWTFEYESCLKRDDLDCITLMYPDGHEEKFVKEEGKWHKKDSKDLSETLIEDPATGYFTLSIKDIKSYTYDGRGKLILVSDRNNNAVNVKYAPGGLVEKIVSPGGKVITFKYELGKISEIIDHTGRKIVYRYNGDRLVSAILPNKGEFIYEYEGPFIVSITDANGRKYVSNKFDDEGRVVRQCVNEQDTVDIKYYPDNNETVFIYRSTGNMERYTHNDEGRLIEAIHSDGTKERFTYDEYGNKNSETDRNGQTTFRLFDNKGNILEEKYPEGYTVLNDYDDNGNLIRTSTSGGAETLYKYDLSGNLIEEYVKINDGEYSKTEFTYDSFGRMLSRADAEGNITEFEYDSLHVDKPTRVKDPEGNIFRYRYDIAGRLEAITTSYGTVEFGYNEINKKTFIKDAQGGITSMSYDRMGNLIKKVLPNESSKSKGDDKAYEFIYDAMDRLIQTTDPLKNVFALRYDLNGNLVKEINANFFDSKKEDGIGIEYIYDKNNRRIKTVLPTGHISRTKYDAVGNVVKTIDPGKYNPDEDNGPGMEYDYDSLNRLTAIKNEEGNTVKEYKYNVDGLLIKETDANKLETLYKYNDAGWLLEKRTAVEENAGKKLYSVTCYSYDRAGRRTEEKRSTQKVSEQETPAKWNTIRYEYDKNSRIVKIYDSTGAQAEYGYDCLGNRTFEKARINDKTCRVIRYSFDSLGRLDKKIEEIDGEDLTVGSKGKALAQTVYHYDKNGNLTKVLSPLGYETEMFYDAADRLIQTIKREKGAASQTHYYKYDKQGNLVSEIDTNGKSIEYEYDSMNRRIKITGKEGEVTRLFYDGAGNIIKHVKPEEYDKEKDDGKGTLYSYDSMNRLVEVRDPLGFVVEKNKYNLAGDLIEKTDALGKSIEYTYYSVGRIKEIYTPGAKKNGRPSQEYTYDALGNITGIKDGEGNHTTNTLDLWGRITDVQKPDGSSEKYEYDYVGNVVTSIDGNGNRTEYEYNSINKLARIIDPAGCEILYKYDLQGRLAKKIDRNRNAVEYMYNKDDNITLMKDAETGRSQEFSYHADGNLISASGMGVVYNYAYTPNMRLKSKSMNGKPMLEYSYDRNGNILELKDLTGRRTNYKYDAAGRMEEVWDSGKLAAAYTYKPDSQLAGIRYGNGVTIEYSYDLDQNVAGIVAKNSEGIEILKHSYEYDNNGNQIKKEENGRITQYTYDTLNRLSKVVYPDVEELFSYDFAGNRTFRRRGSTEVNYSYDKRNRLIEKIEGSEQTRYSYDSNGNLLSEAGKQGTTSYTYDCFNRTEKVRKSNGEYIRNFYDPEGLRSKIEENGRTAWFVYSGRDIVAELDGEKLRAASIRGHELLMQRDGSGESYYYLNNVHGDVISLTDSRGAIVNSYKYDAFGNTIQAIEKVQNRFRYAGEQFDSVTGQYYLRARFYNPVVGRFTQEDTYRGDGLNLYAYVGNNPVNYVDLSGYSKMSCQQKANLYKNLEESRKARESHGKNFWDGMSRKEKGAMAEKITDKMMKKKGYKKLPSKVEGNHGIDGLYAKYDKNGNVKELIVNETKFNSKGKLRLNKKTSMGPQMSNRWVRGNTDKMMTSNDAFTRRAGYELDDVLDNNRGILNKTANVISPDGKIQWFNLP
ncbi:RHS repeat-associated core domain-containing protein [Pseudobacteroides cellulosolvens]|uniref:RHS repeat-associated core domain containing protein-containing protein n=1 Tax=Pseudobacteroides cellulosolvens ATCC 35603 = DSM 2933 TaxID=398512 RepID=A0A0L6JQH7_9FIRM|nr:RHS repeat-associated core domain-containing protein [Pseudobacteroides cellulosolvens]KNY27945.1 RHS repeat-associated core domain containing protein-containing protein [Pseudobacteroides cellulosolvens ATCC 35603 = DSM 2933]